MRELNKYWKLSWGYIFDCLDKEAHRIAVERIGECVTVSAEIKYLSEIEKDENFTYWNFDIIHKTNSSITLNYSELRVFATFTFIKRKWENTKGMYSK